MLKTICRRCGKSIPSAAFYLLFALLVALPASAQENPSPGLSAEGDFLHATKLQERGLYELAVAEYEHFLRANPNHPRAGEASYQLGISLAKLGRLQEARSALQLATINLQDTTRAIEALHQAARVDLALGDTARAIESYLAVPVLYPETESLPRTLLRAGRLQVEQQNWSAAERTLGSLLRDFPGSSYEFEARLLLARSYAARGDYQPALVEGRLVASNSSDDSLRVAAGYWIGRWELDRLNTQAALKVWNDAVQGLPDAPGASWLAYRLGIIQTQLGQLDQGEQSFKNALELAENDLALQHAASISLADVLFRKGEYESSLEQYSLAADLTNKDSQAIGITEAAAPAEIRMAMSDSTLIDSSNVALRMAWCSEYLGEPEKALQYYADVTAPGKALTAALAEGSLHIAAGRIEQGVDGYLRAIDSANNPTVREAARLYAVNMLRDKDPELALYVLRRSEPVVPSMTPVADELAWMAADLLDRTGQHRDAVNQFRSLAERYPASPLAQPARERVKYLREVVTPEEGAEANVSVLLADVLEAHDSPEQRLKLAEAQLALRQMDKARDVARGVISSQPPDTIVYRARVMYARAIEKQWKQVQHTESMRQRTLSDQQREAAGLLYRQLLEVYQADTTAIHAHPEISYLADDLALASVPSLTDRIRLRRAWGQRYLQYHPGSSYAPDVRLDLARAYLTRLENDADKRLDSLALVQLRTLASAGPEEDVNRRAIMLLRDAEERLGNQKEADSLMGVLLDGPSSPEKVGASVYFLQYRPDSEAAARGLRWILESAVYHPALISEMPLLVERLLELDRADEARNLFMQAIRMHPNDPAFIFPQFVNGERLFVRAQINEAEGSNFDALSGFLTYAEASSNASHAGEALLRAGRIYDLAGQWNLAEPLFERALAMNVESEAPAMRQVRKRLAHWAFDSGDYEKARSWSLQAAEAAENTDSSIVYDELAIVSLYKQGRLDDALAEVNPFRGKYRNHPRFKESMARFFLEKGRYLSSTQQYGAAADAYRDVLKDYEDTKYYAEAKYEVARDYLEQREAEKSYELLTELTQEHQDHPIMGRVYWLIGNYYTSTGDYLNAFRSYEKVLADTAYKNSWPYVLTNQVRAFKEAGFYEGSLRAARRYLELYPEAEDAFDVRMNMALAYHELGQYELAISHFRRVMPLAEGEDYAAAQFYIAEALERSGRLKESIGEYLRVVHLNRPTKLKWGVTALYNAARVWERLDQPKKAIDFYKEIVAREGLGSPFGRKAQEQVERLETFGH